MKVKLNKDLLIGSTVHRQGSVVDVAEDRAKRLLREGHAERWTEPNVTINATVNGEPVEVAVLEPEPEKAVRKPRRKRKTEAE